MESKRKHKTSPLKIEIEMREDPDKSEEMPLEAEEPSEEEVHSEVEMSD